MSEPNEPAWVTYDQAIAIHSRQLRRFGGAPGLRDEGMLQSALERPVNKWRYERAGLIARAPRDALVPARLQHSCLEHGVTRKLLVWVFSRRHVYPCAGLTRAR